jgi:hypothetical protein
MKVMRLWSLVSWSFNIIVAVVIAFDEAMYGLPAIQQMAVVVTLCQAEEWHQPSCSALYNIVQHHTS